MDQAIGRHWLAYDEYRAGQPHSVTGRLLVLPGLYSPQLDNSRDLLVYLPPGYDESDRRYPVLYMHDGQNLFDRAAGFGGREWQVDETLTELSHEGLAAIVVGLPHIGAERIREYNPFARLRGGRGERYLDFIVETVKPIVDAGFRTLPDREHAGLMGSSMGGLISLYGFFRHPAVFGRVGVMSPALWFTRGAIYDYVANAPHVPGRIYVDHGTHENSASRLVELLQQKGYQPDVDLRYVVEPGGEHSETAWARRLPDALRFLLAD